MGMIAFCCTKSVQAAPELESIPTLPLYIATVTYMKSFAVSTFTPTGGQAEVCRNQGFMQLLILKSVIKQGSRAGDASMSS